MIVGEAEVGIEPIAQELQAPVPGPSRISASAILGLCPSQAEQSVLYESITG